MVVGEKTPLLSERGHSSWWTSFAKLSAAAAVVVVAMGLVAAVKLSQNSQTSQISQVVDEPPSNLTICKGNLHLREITHNPAVQCPTDGIWDIFLRLRRNQNDPEAFQIFDKFITNKWDALIPVINFRWTDSFLQCYRDHGPTTDRMAAMVFHSMVETQRMALTTAQIRGVDNARAWCLDPARLHQLPPKEWDGTLETGIALFQFPYGDAVPNYSGRLKTLLAQWCTERGPACTNIIKLGLLALHKLNEEEPCVAWNIVKLNPDSMKP